MNLTLVVSKNCVACKRAEAALKNIVTLHPELSLSIVNANDFKRRGISIVPALLIDGELFSYGDIEEDKLLAHIS